MIGIGGGGGNAVNRMIDAKLQAASSSSAPIPIVQALRRSGRRRSSYSSATTLTRGLGAGGDPEVGRNSALEDTERILEVLDGADMVFLTAGSRRRHRRRRRADLRVVGGRDRCADGRCGHQAFRTFEGRRRRMKHAERGVEELRNTVDTLITIPNERLLSVR